MRTTLPPLELRGLTKFFLLHLCFETKLAAAGNNISGNKMLIALPRSGWTSSKCSFAEAQGTFKLLWTAIEERLREIPSIS